MDIPRFFEKYHSKDKKEDKNEQFEKFRNLVEFLKKDILFVEKDSTAFKQKIWEYTDRTSFDRGDDSNGLVRKIVIIPNDDTTRILVSPFHPKRDINFYLDNNVKKVIKEAYNNEHSSDYVEKSPRWKRLKEKEKNSKKNRKKFIENKVIPESDAMNDRLQNIMEYDKKTNPTTLSMDGDFFKEFLGILKEFNFEFKSVPVKDLEKYPEKSKKKNR